MNAIELSELLDEVVETALGYGVFDDGGDLWLRVARATGRDPDSGNRT